MFETLDEQSVVRIYQEKFPESAKHSVANAIQGGCEACLGVLQSMDAMGIPRSKYFNIAQTLGYNVNRLLTKDIDENNFTDLTYYEDNTGHGRPIVHYRVGIEGNNIFDLHIKKNRSARNLPHAAGYRIQEAKQNEEILLGFPDVEIKHTIFMIVTFNHKRFRPEYMQIGIADSQYKRWLCRWDLMEFVQPDYVEHMQKEYKDDLEEQMEKIQKEYKLEMRD